MSNPPIQNPQDMQALLRHLRTHYLARLPEQLGEMEADLCALARTQRFDETFERCFRRVHALKGGAMTHSVPIISKISQQLEEHLNRCVGVPSSFTPELLERCLAHIDLMRKAQESAQHGTEHFNDVEEALHALRVVWLGQRFSVLIVEASKLNLKLCKDLMKGYPAQVTLLDSGYQALELLLQQKYQLLITGMEVKLPSRATMKFGSILRFSGGSLDEVSKID